MLCSAAELELSDDHDGIIELPDDAPVGVAYATYAGLDDPVIDIIADAQPPRRDRRFRHRARSRRRRPRHAQDPRARARSSAPSTARSRSSSTSRPRTRISARPSRCAWCAASATARRRNGCRSGCARSACRPINALVDITNYLTFDRGRPLHVFDAAKVEGDLVVRRAQAGRKRAGARRQDLRARRSQRRHRRRRTASNRSPA